MRNPNVEEDEEINATPKRCRGAYRNTVDSPEIVELSMRIRDLSVTPSEQSTSVAAL